MYEGALKFISGMFVCFRFSTYQTTSLCLFTQHSLPLVIKKRSESVYMQRFTPVFFHMNALYNYKNERLQNGVTCSRSVRHVVHVKSQEENPKSSEFFSNYLQTTYRKRCFILDVVFCHILREVTKALGAL